MWATIISAISYGSGEVDSYAARARGAVLSERRLNLDFPRRHTVTMRVITMTRTRGRDQNHLRPLIGMHT